MSMPDKDDPRGTIWLWRGDAKRGVTVYYIHLGDGWWLRSATEDFHWMVEDFAFLNEPHHWVRVA